MNYSSTKTYLKLFTLFALLNFVLGSAALAQKEAVKETAVNDSAATTANQCRRRLRAVLYPFVPAKTELFSEIEHSFENKYPEIDLEIIDLSDNYYNTKKPNNIIDASADVYEIDSVFLFDFVNNKRIQELPAELIPASGTVLENARRGSQIGGKWYGSPHWVCGNFLFYEAGDAALQSVKTLSDLERAVTASASGQGAQQRLFIDLKGKSTLGELYLDAAFDRYGEWSQVVPHTEKYNDNIEKDLRRAMLLCSAGFCRSDRYHDTTGFYPRQFARKRGRALVSYSEGLFYALSEAQQSCSDEDACLTDKNIEVAELPLADRGSQPISWVDSLTIDAKCTGQCRKDAIALISFLTAEEMLLKAVTPKWLQPSRYLLPAHTSIYSNQQLIDKAPLYPKLRAIIEKAQIPTGEKLNDKLRAFGEKLDAGLNAQPQ